jgi:hypothetical protein
MKRSEVSLVLALAVLAFAACSSDGSSDDRGTSGGSSPTTVPAATGSPATSSTAQLEGAWSTPTMTTGDHIAAAEAADCPAALVTAHFADWPNDRTGVHILEFADGSLTESVSFDGGTPEVGSTGTYEVIDDHTLAYTEPCCGTTTFDYTLEGDELTLRLPFTCTEAGDPAPFYIFQGAPFERT